MFRDRIFAAVIVCIIGGLQMMVAPARAGEVSRHETPMGHVFWLHPIADAKRSAIAISWPSGLGDLPEGEEMAARIGIEVMLNGGAAGKTPDEIIADFEDLDAGARLFVQPEEIRGFIVTPDDQMEKAAAIASDVLSKPNMDESWFRRERSQLAKSSRGRDKVVEGIAWNLSREIMMADHPYRRFWSIRPAENIERISLETVRRWHSTAFGNGEMTIVAAGTADVAAISDAVDRALEGLPSTKLPDTNPLPELNLPGKTIVFHAPDAAKSAILAFGRLPAATANQDLPMNISLGVLGYGAQSRLFKAVRSYLRAAYRYGAGYFDYTRNRRLLRMGGEVETAQLQAALDTTRETYETFRTGGIGLVEFPFARRFYRQRIEESLAKPTDAAFLLLESRLNGAADDDLATLVSRIDNLDRGAVNTYIAETFPRFDELLVIVVTPDANAVEGDCTITRLEDWTECVTP